MSVNPGLYPLVLWQSPQNVVEYGGFTQRKTEMLVLICSFCPGSTLWRSCLCGFQLANRTAPLYPCLPRKKLLSKPRFPETAPKGKKWNMDHQRGGWFTSVISAPSYPFWDVSAGAFWKRATLEGRSLPAGQPWEQSTSRSQNKILKTNITITGGVAGCSFMGWYAGDTVVGLCVLHQRCFTMLRSFWIREDWGFSH